MFQYIPFFVNMFLYVFRKIVPKDQELCFCLNFFAQLQVLRICSFFELFYSCEKMLLLDFRNMFLFKNIVPDCLEYVPFSLVLMCCNTVHIQVKFVFVPIKYYSLMFQYIPFFVNMFLYVFRKIVPKDQELCPFCLNLFFAQLQVLRICSFFELIYSLYENIVPKCHEYFVPSC